MPTIPDQPASSPPSAVVVIPCLNEEDHIEGVLDHFAAEPAQTVRKIVVADGGSTDRTTKLVEQCSRRDGRIVLLNNVRRIQSSGINRAVEQYGDLAPFIIRADAHSDYPAGFCATLLAAQQTTNADSIVVSMTAKGATCFQKAAATAQNSRLGNGGSAHRNSSEGRFVDHGHHALMKVDAFRSVGGYDEAFSHNEDAELDFRLTAAGYRIYLCPGADIGYYPRMSLASLFRQYRNFGRGRAMTILKHRMKPKLRQAIPVMIGPAVALAALGFVSPVLTVPTVVWAAASLLYGGVLGVRVRNGCACGAGIAAMAMHLGFSVGFISHLVARKVAGVPSARRSAHADTG
jgi:succinoglycan biosynthesis protein ExoA